MDYSKLSTDRLERLRKKYRDLRYAAHGAGASGIYTSREFQEYTRIPNALRAELARRNNG